MKSGIGFIVAILFQVVAASAWACECAERRDRDQSYSAARYVFYAEAITTEDGELRLKVLDSYKGSRRKRTHPVTTGKCVFQFKEGKRYIVFGDEGESKREVSVDLCGATTQLDHEPITPLIWSLADELTYGASSRVVRDHGKGRDKLTDTALSRLTAAATKCDSKLFKKKGEAKGLLEVRFDVEPNGEYTAVVEKYESSTADADEAGACLAKALDSKKFSKFAGGRVSVHAYWMIDRIDSSFGREKKSATVVPFGRSTN